MAVQTTSWLDLERGVFLAFAVLVVYVGANFLLSRPRPIPEELTAPRTTEGERRAPQEELVASPDPGPPGGRDMLVTPQLQQHRLFALKPPKPDSKPDPQPDPRPDPEPAGQQVKLPGKPAAKPVKPDDPEPKEEP